MNATITLTGEKGKVHNVLAVRPLNSNPKDGHLYVVLHRSLSDSLVVHTYNSQDDGFFNGIYCGYDMVVAMACFNSR